MHIQNCEHPLSFVHPYTHEHVVVPCGKCVLCRKRKNDIWVRRLENERLNNVYTVFFTLTYDNEHLPKVSPKDVHNIDTTGWSKKDYDYFNNSNFFPAFSVEHLQKFIKRLRYHAKQKIRYYIVSERGPRTHRSHYHGLLFFNSSRLAKEIINLIRENWKYGFINAQFVCSSSSSYVAGYLNCDTYLPSIYKHPDLRPFSLKSVSPPIGFTAISEKQMSEIFYRADVKASCYDNIKQKVVDVPLWRSLETRLFPKFPLYSQFDDSCRESILRASYDLYDKTGELNYFITRAKEIAKKNTLFGSYLNYAHTKVDIDSIDNYSSYRTLYYVCNAIHRNCNLYSVSPFYHIKLILKHYANKASYLYSQQIEFMNEFVLSDDIRFLVNIDPVFVNKVSNRKWSELSESDKLILDSFDITPYEFSFGLDMFSPFNSNDFKNYQCQTIEKLSRSRKIRHTNECLMLDKNEVSANKAADIFNNPIL